MAWWRALTRASLDDLGNQVQTRGDLRRVGLVELVVVGLGDLVGTQPLREPRERVRHRGDLRGIGAFQGADELEDPRQALLVDGNFRRTQFEARQGCDQGITEKYDDRAMWENWLRPPGENDQFLVL